MAFTRKFSKRRRTTKKSTRKRTVKRRRVRTSKNSKLRHVTGGRKRIPIMSFTADRKRYSVVQSFNGNMIWTPTAADTGGEQVAGYLISMNAMLDTFFGNGNGTLQYGIPYGAVGGGSPMIFDNYGQSGTSDVPGTSHYPPGLQLLYQSYKYTLVESGVFTITVSQDSAVRTDLGEVATPYSIGSTRVMVCGFCPRNSSETLTDRTNGHFVYPSDPSTLTVEKDGNSTSTLRREPNCKSALITNSFGSRSYAKIIYPWTMNKYAAIGYWTNASNFSQTSTNPSYQLQPRILVQFHNSSSTQGIQQEFRVEMSMRWNITAFERYPQNLMGAIIP